jgi:flavodoxin
MQIAVVYASRTGNTRRAAELIGTAVEERGHSVTIQSVDDLDYKALADADLIVLGTWVSGHFVIGQKPGDARRLAKVPKLTGKPVAVFLTYALNPGSALGKLEKALVREGADVIGGYAWKRSALPAGIEDFVDGVLGAVKPASA